MQLLVHATGTASVVWAMLFSAELQSQIHKHYNGAHIRITHKVLTHLTSRTGIHCRTVNSKEKLNLQRHVHLLLGVPSPCHFKLTHMSFCLSLCSWVLGIKLGGHTFDSLNLHTWKESWIEDGTHLYFIIRWFTFTVLYWIPEYCW